MLAYLPLARSHFAGMEISYRYQDDCPAAILPSPEAEAFQSELRRRRELLEASRLANLVKANRREEVAATLLKRQPVTAESVRVVIREWLKQHNQS